MIEENSSRRGEMPGHMSMEPATSVLDDDRVDQGENLPRPEGTSPVLPVRPARRETLLEVLVSLFLIVPSMVLSFFLGRREAQVSFVFLAVATILRDLSLVRLVLLFVWRNGEPHADGRRFRSAPGVHLLRSARA